MVYNRLGGNDRQYYSSKARGTCDDTRLTYIQDNWENFVILVASSDKISARKPSMAGHKSKTLNAQTLYYQKINYDVKCDPVMLAGVFENTENRIIAPKNRKNVQVFTTNDVNGHRCPGNLADCQKTYTTKHFVAFAIA